MELDSEKSWKIRQALENELIRRAQQDPAFRAELLRNPAKVLARASGGPLPPGVQVVVHEETPTIIHLVLPPNPTERPSGELADNDLEQVAGGGTWCYDYYWGWYQCG